MVKLLNCRQPSSEGRLPAKPWVDRNTVRSSSRRLSRSRCTRVMRRLGAVTAATRMPWSLRGTEKAAVAEA